MNATITFFCIGLVCLFTSSGLEAQQPLSAAPLSAAAGSVAGPSGRLDFGSGACQSSPEASRPDPTHTAQLHRGWVRIYLHLPCPLAQVN